MKSIVDIADYITAHPVCQSHREEKRQDLVFFMSGSDRGFLVQCERTTLGVWGARKSKGWPKRRMVLLFTPLSRSGPLRTRSRGPQRPNHRRRGLPGVSQGFIASQHTRKLSRSCLGRTNECGRTPIASALNPTTLLSFAAGSRGWKHGVRSVPRLRHGCTLDRQKLRSRPAGPGKSCSRIAVHRLIAPV